MTLRVALRVALHGASGRMGRAIADVIAGERDVAITAAFAAPDEVGREIVPGVRIAALSREALAGADVVIDFTTPAACAALASICPIPLVSGTTGLAPEHQRAIDELAARVPVVHAPNMSVGVTVLFHLAELATRLCGEGFDAEIVEMHHRLKVDAPSGTAVRLAERVARARGLDPKEAVVHGRSGQVGARKDDEIGVMTLRGGSVVGEHTLFLAGKGERLELVHRAEDRSVFARGAVRAARWITDKKPGRYDMPDVLGIGQRD